MIVDFAPNIRYKHSSRCDSMCIKFVLRTFVLLYFALQIWTPNMLPLKFESFDEVC